MKKTDPGTHDESRQSNRHAWYRRRMAMEGRGERIGLEGHHSHFSWKLLKFLVGVFGMFLRCFGLYQRGLRNALDLRLTRLELAFPDLPAEFDGFRILQLSDLHFDALPGTMETARALVAQVEVDLCVLTGDYRHRVSGPYEQILPAMEVLSDAVKARHGICAILGNHDSGAMAEAFERLGITMLLNETLSLERPGGSLRITGTDDVHYYFTEAARTALRDTPDGFKIALVHSPELAEDAAAQGFRLYLTGHTHGGQICLPGGRPILTNLVRHRPLVSGSWCHQGMQGYTSKGVGVSALPVRFNSRGEVLLLTLRRTA